MASIYIFFNYISIASTLLFISVFSSSLSSFLFFPQKLFPFSKLSTLKIISDFFCGVFILFSFSLLLACLLFVVSVLNFTKVKLSKLLLLILLLILFILLISLIFKLSVLK